MIAFTQEELQRIADTDHVQSGDASAIARMLLASLNATPIYQVQYGQKWRDVTKERYEDYRDHGSPTRIVYAEPPAPVEQSPELIDYEHRMICGELRPLPKFRVEETYHNMLKEEQEVNAKLAEYSLNKSLPQPTPESEDRKMLKRLAVIMPGSDSGGEISALTVTAQSLVDRCKTLALEKVKCPFSFGWDELKRRTHQDALFFSAWITEGEQKTPAAYMAREGRPNDAIPSNALPQNMQVDIEMLASALRNVPLAPSDSQGITRTRVVKHQITGSMAKDIALKLGAELNDEEADIFADGYNAAVLNAEPLSGNFPLKRSLRDGIEIIRNAGIPVDADKIQSERNAGNLDGLNIRAVAALRAAVRNQWLKSDDFADKVYWKSMHSIANEIVEAMMQNEPPQPSDNHIPSREAIIAGGVLVQCPRCDGDSYRLKFNGWNHYWCDKCANAITSEDK